MLDPGFDRIFGRTDTRIAVLEEMPVDGQLASALAALRTMQMDGYAAVRVHALWSKVISWATAQQMIATNDAISGIRGLVGPPDDLNEPYRIAAQEIANATAITRSRLSNEGVMLRQCGETPIRYGGAGLGRSSASRVAA